MSKLTKRLIDTLQAREKEYAVWDDELKGFGVRISPKGVKTFQAYWRAGNRERKRAIGRYPAMTVDQARREAFNILSQVEQGNDPAVKQDLIRKAETMTELCERFMTEYGAHHKKAKSLYEDRRHIDGYLLPAFGKVLAIDISKVDVRRLHQSFSKTPYQANRILALLSKIFNFAADDLYEIRNDWRNPTVGVTKFKEEKRRRYVSEAELHIVAEAIVMAEEEGLGTSWAIAALRLLIFTGARKGEILTLEWKHVDWERRCLSLPDSKTGAKDIPLNAPALAILRDIERLTENPYVIVGKFPGTHMDDVGPTWRRIIKLATILMLSKDEVWGPVIDHLTEEKGTRPTLETLQMIAKDKCYSLPTGVSDVRIHDLRHSFASIGVGAGITLHQIGGLMGHTQAQTTMRYAHLATDPQHQATEEIGRRLSSAMASNEESAEIIKFKKR